MTDRRAVANLAACWNSLGSLLTQLEAAEWAHQSLCPEWTVAGVVTHLAAIEQGLDGWRPESVDSALPFAGVGAFSEQAAAWTGAELAERFGSIMSSRFGQLEAMSDQEWEAPSPTPVGPATYGRFMAIRVFDFWVHEQDIRVPLGRPGNESGPAAEMALDEIQGSLGYIVGKRIGIPDGSSVRFDLTGAAPRHMNVAVEGRARLVENLDSPDLVVTADSTTFALLACGRIDPQGAIDAGRISWQGDDELGQRAARNLRFTM